MRVKNHSGRNRYREWEKSFENGKVVPAAAGAAIKTKSGKKRKDLMKNYILAKTFPARNKERTKLGEKNLCAK